MRQFSAGRRRFTLGAATAAIGAFFTPSKALAQAASTAVPHDQTPASLDQQAKAAMAKLSPRSRAEVEMKAADVFRKYGDRLSDQQKSDIRKILAETQEGLDMMRKFALDNGDQPAAVFQAYHPEGNR